MSIEADEKLNYYSAGFWVRFCAYFLDGMIFLPVFILSLINYFLLKNIFILIVITLIGFIYKPFMEAFFGGTLGKLALNLRVIDIQGNKLTLKAAYIRFIPFFLAAVTGFLQSLFIFLSPQFKSMTDFTKIAEIPQNHFLQIVVVIFSFFSVIDCLIVAFTYRNRALHDMMAKSYCVYSLPKN